MKGTAMALVALACCLTSCITVIEIKEPRWKCSFSYDGKQYSYECKEDTYPVEQEYSVPEFFTMDDGTVVFRFFNKDNGLKLQAACDGPFRYGQRYDFDPENVFWQASFGWLYGGAAYECRSGWVKFSRGLLPGVAYTMSFSYDLAEPVSGAVLQIRDGTFTAYSKVMPRGVGTALK